MLVIMALSLMEVKNLLATVADVFTRLTALRVCVVLMVLTMLLIPICMEEWTL